MLVWSHQDKVTSLHTRHTCLAAVLQGRARAHCMLLQLASPGAGLGVDKGEEEAVNHTFECWEVVAGLGLKVSTQFSR